MKNINVSIWVNCNICDKEEFFEYKDCEISDHHKYKGSLKDYNWLSLDRYKDNHICPDCVEKALLTYTKLKDKQ